MNLFFLRFTTITQYKNQCKNYEYKKYWSNYGKILNIFYTLKMLIRNPIPLLLFILLYINLNNRLYKKITKNTYFLKRIYFCNSNLIILINLVICRIKYNIIIFHQICSYHPDIIFLSLFKNRDVTFFIIISLIILV